MTIRNNLIEDINIEGDFFMLSDLDTTLLDKLRGVRLGRQEIIDALDSTDCDSVIAGLSAESLADLLTYETN